MRTEKLVLGARHHPQIARGSHHGGRLRNNAVVELLLLQIATVEKTVLRLGHTILLLHVSLGVFQLDLGIFEVVLI